MDKDILKKAIELNEQLNELEEIERCILVRAKDHWWSITDAGGNGIQLPNVLRVKFDDMVRNLIIETRKEIESL